nr:GTPase [Serratia proteamaculans]
MGKSGAGKSSLCNALFTSPPAPVSAVQACTRQVQRYPFPLRHMPCSSWIFQALANPLNSTRCIHVCIDIG